MDYVLSRNEVEKLNGKEEMLLKELEDARIKLKELVNSDIDDILCDSEYQSLKKKISHDIPNELANIRQKKANVKIVEEEDVTFDGETVSIGTKVTLDYGDIVETFIILAIYESDSESNAISCNSPIAKTILGRKKGEVIPFLDSTVKIVDVTKD